MTRADRQRAFRELKLGMFIHYNMATYQNVQWVEGYPSPAEFCPGVETIDTDAWADAAKSAGMTYGVLTTQHVAGFCLWDSATTSYGVMHPDCPYQHDLVAQFVESFKRRGLKVGLYYLWRHPGFDDKLEDADKYKYKVLPPECDPASHDLPTQIEFQKRQITELLAKFPDCFYVWNDGLDPGIMPAEDAAAFFESLSPDLITSGNWWDWAKKGEPYLDLVVKETRHFPEGHTAPGETCWTLEKSGWFFEDGATTKPVEPIFEAIETAYARNSNFLLNVGPDHDGAILPSSIDALKQIGERTDLGGVG